MKGSVIMAGAKYSLFEALDPLDVKSKYPIFEVSGCKNHTLNGFGDQEPEELSTWTLRVLDSPYESLSI